MRRAGSARPEAISAARTRSRASDTALSGNPTTLKAGKPGADLDLDIDGLRLDTFECDRADALNHAAPPFRSSSRGEAARQEHLGNMGITDVTGEQSLNADLGQDALLDFMQSTYEARAGRAGWDRWRWSGRQAVE